jgi:hypothetical protein
MPLLFKPLQRSNSFKGPIPSLRIESKLWGKGRFETIENNQTPGNDANFFSPFFDHQQIF